MIFPTLAEPGRRPYRRRAGSAAVPGTPGGWRLYAPGDVIDVPSQLG